MWGPVEVHGQVFACSEKHIVAFVLGCNMDLVGGGWAISLSLCTNGPGRCFSHFIGA